MTWKVTPLTKQIPDLSGAILIEGLPGIGNVGKVAVDFIIDELKAKQLYELSSYALPHSVFVNEKNMVELPSIEFYYKQLGSVNLLLLTGDVQPIDEVSCYEFCDAVLDTFQEIKGKEIITLGGIGLPQVPKVPKVYCTGNSREMIKGYTKGTNVEENLYGIVGPIVGVSGLLLGLAKKRDVKAIALLAETLGHPMYLGVKGAREILKVLDKQLHLAINLQDLDKEIKEIEKEMLKRTDDFSTVSKRIKQLRSGMVKETSYIG